jgi:Holliday junction resolvase-like predicted endonuclease
LMRLQNLTKKSDERIAILLGVKSRSTVNQDINLATEIIKRPELCKISSKSKAFVASRKQSPQKIFEYEVDLHKKLYETWNNSPFANEWSLVKSGTYLGKYNTNEIGEIDLLARSKDSKKWLVVELKQRQSSDDTVGQILRYMGWVKKHKLEAKQTVEGLIICGEHSANLSYALKCLPNIKALVYRFYRNKLDFIPLDVSFAFDTLDQLEPGQQEQVIKKLLEKT